MSVLGLAGYRCHTSACRKFVRPRRSGSSTVGVRGSGEPGDDCRCWVLNMAGRFAVCIVDLRCCGFFGTWVRFVSWRGGRLICCTLRLLGYVCLLSYSAWWHGGNEW